MDNFSWLMADLMNEQRERLHAAARLPVLPERRNGNGMRRALASTMVRMGLRLDPAAGEGLRAYDLTQARC